MKNVWGLGAAVLSLLFVVLFWTVYVTGRLATTERLAPSEIVEGIEVPVIGTVGDFPEPERRHVVSVTADGSVSVGESPVTSHADLVAVLKVRSARSQGDVAGDRRLSGESVVVRADTRSPWGRASHVLVACAEASIDRVFFAVRHERDGSDGAIAAFLPRDMLGDDPTQILRRVCVPAEAGRGTPEAVHEHVAALTLDRKGKLVVTLDVDARVPFGFVARLYDATLRAGAPAIEFAFGVPRWDPSIRADVRDSYRMLVIDQQWELRDQIPPDGVVSKWTLDPASPAPMPPVGRVRGALAGMATSVTLPVPLRPPPK